MKSLNFILKYLELSPNSTLQYFEQGYLDCHICSNFDSNPMFEMLQETLLDSIIYQKDSCYLLKATLLISGKETKGDTTDFIR